MDEPKRKSRGRQKIPIQRIENQDDMYASFSKRRLGLFKKASELCTLCDVDIGVVVFSPTNNPFSFFSPSMDSVLGRYISPENPLRFSSQAIDAHSRARIEGLNKQLDQLVEEKHAVKKLHEAVVTQHKAMPKAWWEETPIHALNKDEVKQWTDFFTNFKAQVEAAQVQQLQNEAFNDQLQNLPAFQNYVPDQFGSSSQFYLGDEAANMMNHALPPPLPLNHHQMAAGGQFNYYGGVAESSINATSNPNYFNQQPPPNRNMFVGSSSTHEVFSTDDPLSFLFSQGDQDPFLAAGGALDQFTFPPPTMGVGGIEQPQFGTPVLEPGGGSFGSFPDQQFAHIPTGAEQIFSAADDAETLQGFIP